MFILIKRFIDRYRRQQTETLLHGAAIEQGGDGAQTDGADLATTLLDPRYTAACRGQQEVKATAGN
jgi:hypothetical protein